MIQSTEDGILLGLYRRFNIFGRIFGSNRSRYSGREGILADVGDHVREGREPYAVEGAVERNLAEVVLADLKGNYLYDPLDPMGRQNFDDLVSEVEIEAAVEESSNFFRQKVFRVFVFALVEEGGRGGEGGEVDEVVELEVREVVGDAAMTVTHCQVV